jgi:uncharacterized membrane protein
MAGIGFALRKLTRRDDLLGILQGYAHSAVISSGPWLFTILSLAGINLFSTSLVSLDQLITFRVIIIYNFAFSVVFTAPITMVATRYLADAIFKQRVDDAPGMMLVVLGLCYGVSLLAAGPFYLGYSGLPLPVALGALANFILIAGVWGVSLFLSALKDYTSVTLSFAVGMSLALAGCIALAGPFGTAGMVWGFSFGLALIQIALIARVLSEYPYPVLQPFAFLGYFRRYWDLALIGLVGQFALWADKWMMWFAPERTLVAGTMPVYAAYDAAMFIAYLTIVPGLMVFTVNIETQFFERYQAFYADIQAHATYQLIQRNHRILVLSLLVGVRNLIILQGGVTALALLTAPQIIDLLNLNYSQIGVFRLGILGAFFQVMLMFCTVLLSYFDLRRRNLMVQLIYFIANLVLTWVFSSIDFVWYGYGYFLASVIACCAAYLMAADAILRLPYIAFVHNNPSIH